MKKIVKVYQCIVAISLLHVLHLASKKGGALHLNKHVSSSPKDSLLQVWLKLAQWFRRGRLFNVVNVLSLFRNNLPLENGGALQLNKLEFPSLEDVLCQVWMELALWFWRRRFFYFVNVFSLFRNKGRGLSLEQTWMPFTQECFVPTLVVIGLVVRIWASPVQSCTYGNRSTSNIL